MLHRTTSTLEDVASRAEDADRRPTEQRPPKRARDRGNAEFRRLVRKWSRVRGPRDIAMRAWKDLRPLTNRLLARYSLLGDPAVFETGCVAQTRLFETEWERVRDEAQRLLTLREALPPLPRVSPDHERIARGAGWRSYFLVDYGNWRERACRRCPVTTRLLKTTPNLHSAFFSVLEPGQHLRSHTGPTKALITWHLALMVPPGPGCQITIDGAPHRWEAGRSLIFDDTRRHEVRNDTEERRVVLLMHLRRPLREPGASLSRVLLGAIDRSPFVRDARRNLDAWEDALDAAASAPHRERLQPQL